MPERQGNMAKGDPTHRKSGGWRDRLEMWRAGRKPVATGFETQPEPRSIGLYARGKQLMAGQFIVGGAVVPLVTGLAADVLGLKLALVVPALCYIGILGFGWYARRPYDA